MSRREKIIDRLLSRPRDFKYDELVTLLSAFGYEEMKTGKTSGSARAFIRRSNNHIIRLHQPHPGNVLKMYQIDLIIEEFKRQNLI